MELSRKLIEEFQQAYKNDYGEDIDYATAHEMAHRLVNIFMILEKPTLTNELNDELLGKEDDEESSNPDRGF